MWLENPVLNRELIETLRSPKAFVLQAVFTILLGGIVLVAWPQEIELSTSEQRSVEIYDTFACGQLVLLALLAPILSAPAISSESERRSLDMLLTSPLSATGIVFGKLLSAVVYLLLLAFSSLPVFSLCFRLGAVGPLEVGSTFLLLFSSAFLCGALGLTASAYMQRSRAALSVSYVIILPFVLAMAFANPMRSPVAAVFMGTVAVVGGMILVSLCQARLRQPFDEAPKAADEEVQDEQIGLVLDRRRFPDNLLSPSGGGTPFDGGLNPVFEKELRHELFGQGTLLVRLLLQFSMVAALPFFIASFPVQGLWIYSFYILVFIMLLAPSFSAGVFTQERERGTLDLLLTTSLSKERVIWGKLAVALRNMAILCSFLFPFMVLFWAISAATGKVVMPGVNWRLLTVGTTLVLLSTAVFAVTLASFFSLICRTTLRSMVFTYLSLLGLFVVPVVVYQILTRFAGMADREAHWVTYTSPFYALAAVESHSLRRFAVFVEPSTAWPHMLFFIAFSLGCSLLLVGAIWLLFNRYCQLRHDHGR